MAYKEEIVETLDTLKRKIKCLTTLVNNLESGTEIQTVENYSALPDASYTESGASTGFRFFSGFTDQTMAVSVGSDNPAGSRVGFSYVNVNGGLLNTNFYFTTKDGTTETRVDTGCPFVAQNIYDFYIFAAPYPNGEVFYRVDNITNNTSFEGSTSSTLPLGTTFMRGGFQLGKVATGVFNIRMQRLYIESDR